MTENEAWEIYDTEAGKAGRPSKKFKDAKLWLIEKELLNPEGDSAKDTKDKKDKKPPLELKLINNPLDIPVSMQAQYYLEGLRYITDKRNFDFDYFLIGQYGITSDICAVWEKNDEIKRLRTIAYEFMEHKLLDAVNDKWSGGNPLGNMLTLKSIFGHSDRGDGGSMIVDSVIDIKSNIDDSDMVDLDYVDSDFPSESEYDDEQSV